MSDTGRKDFTTKAKEEMTPDSAKSTQDKLKEAATDTKDRLARGLQPDENKGVGQEAFDKAQRTSDSGKEGGAAQSIGDKVKSAFGMDK
ncbi:hypothetical protein FQN55_005698 [Onygenales sp. PD_40]|nr:hypothetical protein FQN55_005698 [Onygenales sp. PD_40]KAK2767907.1 hypothetical protein FQN53_006425 [Emmonsiellopsis sp. PD_33]KAK2777911.1 hypothetical protein FQN52_002955 [Onygenales sp. PD_12]KAK2796403.1 hypothetical protein FQN51_009387 [Onygenales sp. PD_10]